MSDSKPDPYQFSPKARYIATASPAMGEMNDSAKWAAIAQTPLYHRAIETALCELVKQRDATNLNDAATMAYIIVGAKKFIDILSRLGEPEDKNRRGGASQHTLTP